MKAVWVVPEGSDACRKAGGAALAMATSWPLSTLRERGARCVRVEASDRGQDRTHDSEGPSLPSAPEHGQLPQRPGPVSPSSPEHGQLPQRSAAERQQLRVVERKGQARELGGVQRDAWAAKSWAGLLLRAPSYSCTLAYLQPSIAASTWCGR